MAESTRLVAARIPDTLAEEAKRYALLARTTLSHVIRRGLELRLHTHRWPRAAGTTPPGSVPTHVAVPLVYANNLEDMPLHPEPPPVAARVPAPAPPGHYFGARAMAALLLTTAR